MLLSSCNDSFTAERTAAEEEIRTAQIVQNNPSDSGIAALVEEFVAKLASAPDTEAIRAVVSEFEAAAEAHASAKAEILAELNAVNLSALDGEYATELKATVLAAREDAILSIGAACTVDEAEEHLAAYRDFVSDKLVQIPFGPCDEHDELFPEATARAELLALIDAYEERVQLLIQELTEVYENAEISEEEYQLALYGRAEGENGEAVHGYKYVLDRITYWQKYVYLAISIDGLREAFEAEIVSFF